MEVVAGNEILAFLLTAPLLECVMLNCSAFS